MSGEKQSAKPVCCADGQLKLQVSLSMSSVWTMSKEPGSKEMIGGCCVCSDEFGSFDNPLVYCDGSNCSVAVHKGTVQ